MASFCQHIEVIEALAIYIVAFFQSNIVSFWWPSEHISARNSATVGDREKSASGVDVPGYARITLRCHRSSAVVNDKARRSATDRPTDRLNCPRPISCSIFKRNAKVFSLTVIVDVRLRRRHEMIFIIISRKLLVLATSKFTTW